MTKRTGVIAIAVILALMFALTVPVAAASETNNIEITNREIRIVVDGVQITPVDAAGNPVEPFIYNGTTYLPVRAVAGALGLSVGWDGETSTVLLTSGAEVNAGTGTPAATSGTRNIEITYRDIKISIDGTEITPTDADGNAVEPFIYDGTTYLPVRAVASALGVEVGWDGETSTVYLGEQPTTTYWLLSGATDYNTDDSVFYEDTYVYDEYGRNTSISRHYPDDPDSDHSVTRTYEGAYVIFEDYGDGYSRYTYDEDGNLISDKYYSSGSLTEWQYSYDAEGNLIGMTALSDDEIAYTSVFTYDSRGDLVRRDTEFSDYTSVETWDMTYDEEDNLISELYSYSDGGYEYGEYYLLVYDSEGNLTTEFQYWAEDGEMEYYNTNLYTYDEYGNIVRVDYDSGYTIYTYTAFVV